MHTRTNTCSFGVIDRPPGVARGALCPAVRRTIHVDLRHAIVTCARFRCKVKTEVNHCEATVDCTSEFKSHIGTRTNTRGSVLVERSPNVARRAVGRTVHRTPRTSLCHTVVARARISCEVTARMSAKCRIIAFRPKCVHVRIHSVLTWLIVHPTLHDAHLVAPLTRQPAPACPTPLLHVHILAAE